ncbi:MAG: hypothetical protein ACR2M9_04900 [Cyanophyceae cyanobacterium]
MKVSDFKTQEEMEKMKVAEIKAHVRAFNEHFAIRGYSKLNKSQLISEVLTAQMRIRNAASKPAPKPTEKPTPQKITKPEPVMTDRKRRTELGRFRTSALLPLINDQGKYQKSSVGKTFVEEPQQKSIRNIAERLQKDATPAEKNAIEALLKIFNLAVSLNEENKFVKLFSAVTKTGEFAKLNKALKEANLKPLPRP